MIITLSPSKGQDFSQPASTTRFTTPLQLDQSELLVKLLRKYDVEAIRDLMSVSERIARLNVDRFSEFSIPFDLGNAKQALFAFTGDVYSAIEQERYSDQELEFAQLHLRMLSGLYGYLRPLDLVQPYRLEMKTRLPNLRGDNLYAFWGERITDQLNADLAVQQEATLLNLASNEYFKAIKMSKLQGRLVNVHFKERKEGKTRVIAIFAKRARGLMANWIIREQVEQSEQIKEFALDGYRFDQGNSDQVNWIFSRPQP